ncbi:MAG: hypothetical protein ING75_08155 [Rhodocyclaceae bacterium]|nr:hypothetical protein [Rhodocyclaceae bacterium]
MRLTIAFYILNCILKKWMNQFPFMFVEHRQGHFASPAVLGLCHVV